MQTLCKFIANSNYLSLLSLCRHDMSCQNDNHEKVQSHSFVVIRQKLMAPQVHRRLTTALCILLPEHYYPPVQYNDVFNYL